MSCFTLLVIDRAVFKKIGPIRQIQSIGLLTECLSGHGQAREQGKQPDHTQTS